jgi:hypothetical protein
MFVAVSLDNLVSDVVPLVDLHVVVLVIEGLGVSALLGNWRGDGNSMA